LVAATFELALLMLVQPPLLVTPPLFLSISIPSRSSFAAVVRILLPVKVPEPEPDEVFAAYTSIGLVAFTPVISKMYSSSVPLLLVMDATTLLAPSLMLVA